MSVIINNIVWQNVSIVMLGDVNDLVTEISYKRTGNHTANYGAGAEPIGLGKGRWTYSGSITMYMEAWQAISIASNGAPQSLAPFDIAIIVIPTPDSPILTPFTDTLQNCVFLEDGQSIKEGDTKDLITIPILYFSQTRFQE